MKLSELKKMAKGRGIKKYYILPKEELLKLLQMSELPLRYRVEKMTIEELRELAKERGLRGFWGLPKLELSDPLFPPRSLDAGDAGDADKRSPQDHHQNDGQTDKHEEPENKNPNDVGVELLKDTDHQGANNMVLDV
jgi:hypothetical protein